MFSNLLNLYLFPSKEKNFFIYAQERIDQFTESFFTSLKNQWKKLPQSKLEIKYLLATKFKSYLDINQHSEFTLYQILDEKVFTLLIWLISFLWTNATPIDKQKPFFQPIMVNRNIKAPELNMQGRPSAVFTLPDDKKLLLIQTYHTSLYDTQDLIHLQVAIYSQILDSIGVYIQHYLYVNYHTMAFIMQEVRRETEYKKLDKFLDSFYSSIVEHNFDPPKNPPCELCEFKLMCQS